MAGVECQPKVSPCKRKAEPCDSDDCSQKERATKKINDCSQGGKGAAVPVVAGDGEEAPAKKMWRLPQEEVQLILAQSNEPASAQIRNLKRANPSLLPSPEEEKDEYMVLLYTCARSCYEAKERFAKFQAWVRCEYKSKGFVEVDYDYFGERAKTIRVSNEARDEVFKDWDLSSDSEDDYVCKLVKRKIRSVFSNKRCKRYA